VADGRFSDDRKWWWDGKQWMASTSADGRWQWDGAGWQPVAAPTAGPFIAPRAKSSPGFLTQIPGFRTMTPWKMLIAAAGYASATLCVLVAISGADPGKAIFGLGVVALAVVGANGWGMRSRLPGIRSSRRVLAAGTWAGLFVALLSVSAMASTAASQPPASPSDSSSPSAATTAPPKSVAESKPAPTSKPTAIPQPSPSASPTSKPTPVPTAAPTAVPTALPPAAPPAAVPAPPAPPAPAPPADPYAAATAAGASAVCADGTWSFSANRSGTCSHHGGVHWWTGNLGPAGPGAH
jgi:Protein of unknown function (DUF3761)